MAGTAEVESDIPDLRAVPLNLLRDMAADVLKRIVPGTVERVPVAAFNSSI